MKFRKNTGVITPTKGYSTDAGWDLYSPVQFTVKAHAMSDRIDMGIGFEIPFGYVGFIMERSSQGKKGIHSIGPVVDHGYTGNVHVTLVNNSEVDYTVNLNDKISQLVVIPVFLESLEEGELTGERGDNGHGSTGR